MWRFSQLVNPARAAYTPRRYYQNFVMSEELARIERECNRFCPVPRFPPHKVAVIGAGSDVGRVASLFLKQQRVIKSLALYDELPEHNVLGVATDLAHIDTSTEVEAYQGRVFLKNALDDADVALICGGCYVTPPCCNIPDRELFFQNMKYVRTAALACAQFCPQAVLAVQTPPVDCNLALCLYTLKQNRVYDKRRVLGVNAINAMRANQLFCSLTGADPAAAHTPVVCGAGRCTRVPVFSAGKAGNFPQSQVDCLTRLVREADDIICRVKSNNEQGHLSIGFATARFVVNIMKGLFEKPTFIDSALVEQADPEKCYNMPICATPVTIGAGGIVEYAIPTLNAAETMLLEDSKCDLEDMLNLGRCYAEGDEYFLHPDKVCPCCICPPCKVCDPCEIPSWIDGTLIRNGPGSLKVGAMRFKHLFDSSALLHRFAIHDGHATYQCRFLRSNTFKKNRAADRIVVTEFGTKAVPDPCHTIFDRVASLFKPSELLSDNAMISVYPFGDEIYAFTEGPVIHRIDPVTLDTLERKNLMDTVALVNHTSHPHVMPNGDVYNVGMSILKGRLRHVVVKFPFTEKGDMFENARVVGSMKPRWPLHPAYMHTFGMTENFFVIVEQPLTVSVCGAARSHVLNRPLISSLHWYPEEETHIVLISRQSGKEVKRFRTDTLFFLHIINCFEMNGKMFVDICAYKDAKVLDAMYIHAIENMQSNADYAEWFRARPKRLEMSLDAPRMTKVQGRLLADIGCETPRIHYSLLNGRPYQYFYAISSDVDAENPGAIIKVDTVTGDILTWHDTDWYPSEPVFIPHPNAKAEDDGVLVIALVRGAHELALLVLDARSLRELARASFRTPTPSPKSLHGWFLPEKRS
ncbi:carotenoid isomerooxygenase-like [Epargyreus clarus]|uniref:carotenoid isomerooxygenase-like n=1 Tax=Epargyreus clarus TaxID=520877 RepID=UPI003C30E2BC